MSMMVLECAVSRVWVHEPDDMSQICTEVSCGQPQQLPKLCRGACVRTLMLPLKSAEKRKGLAGTRQLTAAECPPC